MSARLFPKIKNFLFLFFFFWSCISYAQEFRFIENVNLSPEKLEYFRDSVRFKVEGSIPIESVVTPRNPKAILIFRSSNNSLDLGELELKKNLSDYSFEAEFRIAFKPWMQEGFLELQFFQGKKETTEPFEKRTLAQGIILTPFLAKVGKASPNEPIPDVGLIIPAGAVDQGAAQTKSFLFQFDPGSSVYKSSTANEKQFELVRDFVTENPDVKSVKITGIQSPENSEGKNSKLGMDRAQSLLREIQDKKLFLRDSMIEVGARWNDWFDFRLLLRDFAGLSTSAKDQYYDVLMNGDDFLTQKEKLKDIRGFDQVARQLYPKLRAAKLEVIAKPGMGIGLAKMNILQKELTGNSSNSELEFLDWALAAESSARLEEKSQIYIKMTELFRSPLPYNNLAVVRMQQAQRTFNPDEKENLWAEAEWLLQQALRIEENPYSLHNLGQILALRGYYWEAYKYLSNASVLTRNPDFLKRNEALRGALDILRGDYKLATLRFDFEYTEPSSYFNKGLAHFLAKEYAKASLAFEESVFLSREFGYGYYGLALLAVNSGQLEVATIQLQKAIEANEELYKWMLFDPSFEEIRNSEDFFEILRND
ncbi:hypothetical protein E4S40_11605 [Algoriphagus kandeliae]|uniref:Uncharacterized protein n=1 Tax=Algoriphagus kandeliae TaxID=2562278 RepID=A0A4Y9QPW8_9BACT|nr:hypothetical protein [Algoriphagus kandeliae]TFV94649.1 hypothetical protein E4S40_11605 [Algoriphagus kandeliae]